MREKGLTPATAWKLEEACPPQITLFLFDRDNVICSTLSRIVPRDLAFRFHHIDKAYFGAHEISFFEQALTASHPYAVSTQV